MLRTKVSRAGLLLRIRPRRTPNTKQLTALTVTVASLDTRVGSLEAKVEGHDHRFDTLEEQIRAQGRVLGDAIYGLTEQFREHLRLHAS